MPQKNETFARKLLKRARIYLEGNALSSSLYRAAHPIYYLSSWAAGSLGYYKLKCMRDGKLISKEFGLAYIRSFLSLRYQYIYEFSFQLTYSYNKYVIVSWCCEKDFQENGSFNCKYFNENSRNTPDTSWVLISLDNYIPLKVDNNISIFSWGRSKKISLYTLIRNIAFCIKNKIPFLIESIFAQKFSNFFIDNMDVQHLKQVLLPYEAQPWQHLLCLILKKINVNTKIIGDLHSCLPPLPTDFIKRGGAPDKVIVHGQGQKDIMIHSLGWDNKDIEVCPSRRFIKNCSSNLVDKILLPYTLPNSDFVLNTLTKILQEYGTKLGALKIKNHPAQIKNSDHLKFIKKIKKIQKKFCSHINKSLTINVSIVIGASSVVIECLTRGIKVFHITEDPVFSCYDSSIWKEIKIIQIAENIWEYKPTKILTYLNIG